MGNPGEVNQATGRAYQYAFIAALEASIEGFENLYCVETEPDKTSFIARTGKNYSFDFSGVFRTPFGQHEVFAESKGYSRGSSLLGEYRSFLAKAYVTTTDHLRHKNDLFWFVTNVPFACGEGLSTIRSLDFVYRTLSDKSNDKVHEILGDGFIDRDVVYGLVDRLGVFILTDSFLMNAKLSYRVVPGDTLWDIMKRFHAGHAPYNFGSVAQRIAGRNGLNSPDKIVSGTRICIPWFGLKNTSADEIASTCVERSQSAPVIDLIAASAPQSDEESAR